MLVLRLFAGGGELPYGPPRDDTDPVDDDPDAPNLGDV